jgi:hypothetical protein
MKVAWLALPLALAAWGRVAAAPPDSPPVAQAARVGAPPAVDGRVLDDPVWQSVPPLTEFWQKTPDAGEPASEPTEVRIVYTADTLYFGVVCFDSSPGGLTVSDARRDSSLDDTDSFQIVLDTYRDGQNGFVFGTNPAGLEYDGQVSNEGQDTRPNVGGGQAGSGGGFNLNWDGSWDVRTLVTADGWSAEFAIPFRTLRYESGSGREWGLNFQRNIRRRKEVAYWSPLPIQFDLMRVSLAGTIAGLDVPPQRNLKLVPYVLGEASGQGVPRTEATTGEFGGDLKYSVTPSLTLDATYNTDFAQVEVDELQINLDRFNLFYPEKRPFFLENAGLFAVGSPSEAEVFFSRRIGIADDGSEIPIVAGGRLSGLAGPINVGFLNMQTEAAGGTPGNNFTAARVRRDFQNRSNAGAIFVDREAAGDLAGSGDYNRTLAADGRLGIKSTGLISGFVARTWTPGLSGSEHAYQVQARNETEPLTLSLGYLETGSNFNPEVGFLSRDGGFRKLDTAAIVRIRPRQFLNLQEIRPHSIYRAFWDLNGFQQTGFWHLDSHWEFKNAYEVHTGLNTTREGVVNPFEIYPGVTVPPGTYDHHEAQLVFQTNSGAAVSGRSQLVFGGYFGGDRVAYTQTGSIRFHDVFTADLSWQRNDIDLPGGSFVTNLARARVSYSFSPRMFVQGLLQYNDRDGVWATNLRFAWLQTASAGLFVVYTDSHFFDDPVQTFTTTTTGRTDRSFTVKFSRMFDLLQ